MSKNDRGLIADFLTVAIGWIGGIIFVMGLLFITVAQEDDLWFNCHISGNMVCGEGTAWHGFVNLGRQDR